MRHLSVYFDHLLLKPVAGAIIGIQGHRIYIDEDGDAEANYTVMALLEDKQQTRSEMAGKSLQPIGHFMLLQDDIPVIGIIVKIKVNVQDI